MVIRTSNLMPEMREAFFKCIVCSFTTSVEIDRGRITEPTLCTNCNTNHCFTLIHNRSQFTDKQMIKLQESPGEFATIILVTDSNLLGIILFEIFYISWFLFINFQANQTYKSLCRVFLYA